MINAISAADIAFIMSSSTSAWLLSLLACSPQNEMAECFASVSEDKLCEKCIMKQLLNSAFARYHAQPHPIIVYYRLIDALVPEVFLDFSLPEMREPRSGDRCHDKIRVAKRRERKTSGYFGLEPHFHADARVRI